MTLDRTFRNLHAGPDLLILPNAWDAGSARLIESLGAKAIATTSAGLAWSRGYPDGDALPLETLLAATREISRIVRVPLTIDVEGGYSDDPSTVARTIESVIEAGAVGINIEDGAKPPELLCAKIEAVRKVAVRTGVDLFINVRTDVYLRGLATGEAAVEEVIRRARLYRSAGGDGLFVPGLANAADIGTVVAGVNPLPVNIMLVPGLPTVDVLRARGVRRLSAGGAIAQAALARVSRLTTGLLAGGLTEVFAEAVPYGATNQLFAVK